VCRGAADDARTGRAWPGAEGDQIVSQAINLEVRTQRVNDHTAIVTLIGEMDVYTTPRAKEAMLGLLSEGYYLLVVNLHGTEYLDSTALGVLVGTLKRVREQGGDLRLAAPSPRVRRLLEITRLNNVFSIDDTEQEATEHIQQKGNES